MTDEHKCQHCGRAFHRAQNKRMHEQHCKGKAASSVQPKGEILDKKESKPATKTEERTDKGSSGSGIEFVDLE